MYRGVKSPGTRLRVRMMTYMRLVAAKAIEQGLYCRDVVFQADTAMLRTDCGRNLDVG